MSEYNGLKGTSLVLWATEEDRKAIRLVELFLILAPLVGRSLGIGILQVRVADLHEHFHKFIEELVREGVLVSCEPLFKPNEHHKCRAIILHALAFDDLDIARTAWSFDLYRRIEPPSNFEEMICARAELGGVFGSVEYGELLNAAQKALVLMGSVRATEKV